MTEVFDIGSELPDAFCDRAAAWRFIAGFAAHWQEPLRPGDGCSAAELDAAEHRLGLRLPAVLREAYTLFGRRTDLTSNHDTLLPPDELYVRDGALVYRAENQGCAFWGVLLDDLYQDDPRTVMRLDLADKSQERWEPWVPSLTAACVEMVMSEVVLFDDGLTDHLEIFDEAGELDQLYQALPGPGRDIRWFTGPDVLIREADGAFLSVRARTKEALDTLRDALPGDWLNA